MSQLIIRQGELKDVEEIAVLEKKCFKDPWSAESIRDEIEKNDFSMYIVAEIDGKVVGYVGVWYIVDEGHITNVAVDPDYRRKHIGSALIHTLIEFSEKNGVRNFTLEVRVSNISAQKLYEGFGFKNEGIRPGYYNDNEDAIIMWRMEE